MYKKKEEKDGLQPEEISMMPKRGWGSNGKLHDEEEDEYCGAGSCRPSFLQKFSGIWTFTIMVGITSLGADFVHLYLESSTVHLKRHFQIVESDVVWMKHSSEIACVFSALLLSIFARKIHIPKVLAITSLIAGLASLFCIIPYATTKGDLVPAPYVMENQTFSIEKFQMMAPSCIANEKAMAVVNKLMREAAMKRANQKHIADGKNKKTSAEKPTAKPALTTAATTMPAKVDSNNNTQNTSFTPMLPTTTSVPKKYKTITIPNFQKLSTHPNFNMFVQMSKTMKIDLPKLVAMDVQDQAKYVDALPDEVKAMLPKMKMMLGDNPDSYFMNVTIEDTSDSRTRRSVPRKRIDLTKDPAYTGQISKMMRSGFRVPPEILSKALRELCPFNTGPFLTNSSTGILNIFHVAMIIQGLARGPRIAYGVTFIRDNTHEMSSVLYLGILYGISHFGFLLSQFLSFVVNATNYLTMEDVGFMTPYNPRWIGAWWIGFIIMFIIALIFSLPLLFFPKKLKSSGKLAISDSKSDNACFGICGYIKDWLSSLFSLCTSLVYLPLLLSHILTSFVSVGALAILVTYVSHQFSLKPLVPGITLLFVIVLLMPVGSFIGGIIASKGKFSALGNLKFALGLACALAIIQACHLGLGCSSTTLDKSERIVKNISDEFVCSATCPCSSKMFVPSCGSDGRTYYSPCHAGCGEGYDGKFHDCKCVEDAERTVTPGYCSTCDTFIPFCIIICIGSLLLGMQYPSILVATYRSVKAKDVPTAIGLQTCLVVLFGVVSVVVYKSIMDSQCLLRIPECAPIDSCVRYDVETIRHHIFGLSLGLQALAAVFLLIAFLFGRKSSLYHQEQIYAKDQIRD